MTRERIIARAILAVAALLASLTVVAWRQSAARAVLAELDAAERELAELSETRSELARVLDAMEARPWVAAEAGRRLGMRAPAEHELVITSGDRR